MAVSKMRRSGRAVIGGLLCATVATLIFVPSVFALLHGRNPAATGQPIAEPGDELTHA